MIICQLFIFTFTILYISSSLSRVNAERSKPNIVILMVDDLGVADLGCFGNDSLKTPNIDKIASQGARLTHSLSSESICTPSRAAFLTGRYAVRSGMVPSGRNQRVLFYSSVPGGLPRNETTFARALQNVGYSTGLIGKWHLGLNKEKADDFHYHPIKHGFQHFYGVPLTNLRNCNGRTAVVDLVLPIHWKSKCAGTILVTGLIGILAVLLGKLRRLYFILFMLLQIFPVAVILFLDHNMQVMNCFLMRDYAIVEQPLVLENLTARFTNDAIDFIEANQENPFLLFMSYLKVHTALFTTQAFKGHSGHSKYGDNVEEMDWSVGKIVDTLDRLGIRNNTFVYFTSDHGPHLEEVTSDGEYHGGWKGTLKGGKGQSWEGGIRVPSIATWPSHIPAGIEVTEPTIDLDIFPTVLNIAGASLPDDRIIDGEDMLPLLKQQAQYTPNEFMFHYCAKAVHAVRYRPRRGTTTWKAHFMTPKWTPGTQACFSHAVCGCYGKFVNTHDPPLLYDITMDPAEEFPINPSDANYKAVIKDIATAMENHEKTVESVPLQLEKCMWRPWLQSCCNFPRCKCYENVTDFRYFPE